MIKKISIVVKIVCFCSCLLTFSAQAQVPQDLIDKAKAAGMTDAQIQEYIRQQQSKQSEERVKVASEDDSGAVSTQAGKRERTLEEQRADNMPQEKDLSETVFGREIFSNKNLTFAPDYNIPTPKGYTLAAGDELLVNVWGDSELNLKLTVSPDGAILVPSLGPVSVAGMTVSAAERHLSNELGQIMSTIGGGATHVSISLSKIRSIKVNIVGEAVAPGTYTLPSFATLFNALYAAGGVNDIGSLRNIKLYRNSREVASLDVYDYLLRGQETANVRLEENDMIIIGPYEQLVVTRGKVKRNRIFEMRHGETLQQLMEMTGGFTGDAYTNDVRIKRKAGGRYQIATVNDNEFGSFVMQDGDSLLVDSIAPFYENRLTIMGAVWRPGEYALSDKLHTVKQLVEKASGVKGDEFAGRAQITRLNKDFTTTMLAVDIKGVLGGTSPDVELQPEDILNILSIFNLRESYTIRVRGAINYGDTLLPYQKNMTIEDAILMGGGLRESAASIHVEVARRIKDPMATQSSRQTAKIYTFTLTPDFQVAAGDTIFSLEPFDEVFVRFSPGYREQQVVKVGGEITFAGNYVLANKNSRLSDIIAQAGGITPDAYVRGATLKRQLTEDEMQRIETFVNLSERTKQGRDSIEASLSDLKDYSVGIDLVKALKNPGSSYDVVLRDGDELFIPQRQSVVKVSGAVTYPNSVTYSHNMSVRECLSQAGGYNDMARKYPMVIYMNGQVKTTRRTFVFFKRYPKVEPGCEIVVPTKTQTGRGLSVAEIVTIGSSVTAIAAMVVSIINSTKSNN